MSRGSHAAVRRAAAPGALSLALATLLTALLLAPATPVAASAAPTAPVAAVGDVDAASTSARATQRHVLGRTVAGREIVAYRVGNRQARFRAVLVAGMHGNEKDVRLILNRVRQIVERGSLDEVDLWILPNYNPDGLVRNTRQNANGVDLNRNFTYRWKALRSPYYSGARANSEPETRAFTQFLRSVRPHRILSFHQPLYGVDVDTKNTEFARRVAYHLQLPRKSFTCGGVCHGTMTGWYNHNFGGAALTVEYGASPSRSELVGSAPYRVLRVLRAEAAPYL